MTAGVVIVAAGKGVRFGNSGKVLSELRGRPALSYVLETFDSVQRVTEIVVVAGEHTESAIIELVEQGTWQTPVRVVLGGDTRQESTSKGVAAISRDASVILVHDGARPMVRAEQVDECIDVVLEHGAAILAAPVTDTIKQVDTGLIERTVDRSTLWAAQTPQGFRADLLREMMASTTIGVTDEASLAEHLGHKVHIVPGDSTNLKITHPIDLVIAEALLQYRKDTSE